MLNTFWLQFLNSLSLSLDHARESFVSLGYTVASSFSVTSFIDLVLVFCILWWLYRKLRRTELIKILPRVFALLAIALLSNLFGMVALYYVSLFLLALSAVAIASIYAPEIKQLLVADKESIVVHRPPSISFAEQQQMVRHISEAVAVLSRSRRSSLVLIKTTLPVSRLVERGTKVSSRLTGQALIDNFAPDSETNKGAVIVDGNKILAIGSTLYPTGSKLLFNPTNPQVRKAVKEFNVIAVITSRAGEDITVLASDNSYKNLRIKDLPDLLTQIISKRK